MADKQLSYEELKKQNEELQKQVNFLDNDTKRLKEIRETMRTISSRFVGNMNIDEAINSSLANIGEISGASRAYLFLFRDDNKTMDNTHEWCAKGVTPEKGNLKNLPVTMFPWWMKKLNNGEIIHIKDTAEMPPEAKAEKEILEAQDIKSLIVLPVYIEDELSGFIGFDNILKTADWQREDIIFLLRTSSEIIGNALKRKYTEKQLRLTEFSLENATPAVFWITPDGKFSYVNDATARHLGYSKEELKNMNLAQIEPYYQAYKKENQWAKLKKNKSQKFETVHIKKDGTHVPVEITSHYVNFHGEEYAFAFAQDITDRKKKEEEIHKREEDLRTTLHSIGDAVISTDLNGNIVRMNPVAQKLTGWDYADANGRSLEEVFQIVNSLTGEKVEDPVLKIRKTGNIVGLANHTMLTAKDGNKYQIADSGAPIKDSKGNITGVVLVFRDVTEDYRLREALKQNEEQLKRAQSIAKLGSWQFNLSTGIVHASEEARKIYGLPHDKTITIPEVQKIPLPEYRPMLDKALEKLIKKEDKYEVEFKIKRPKDGRILTIYSFAEYDEEQNTVTGTIQDITKRKEAEEKIIKQNREYEALYEEYLSKNEELQDNLKYIREINAELKRAKEKAEESDRLKSAFLANMSHEIRTPLNAVIGFTQLLNKNNVSPERRENYMNIIQNKSHLLLQLINDVIDLSKIDANQISLKYKACSLNRLLSEIYNSFKVKMKNEDKHHHLTLTLQNGLNDHQSFILTDNKRLEQIISNLLNNAVKFTEKGSITFGYEKYGEDTLQFYVTDTGIGISKEMQSKIFSRFHQANESITKTYGGTGLGLSIAKSMVEMLGGQIWVESEENSGTTFYFTLPYKKPEANSDEYSENEAKSENLWDGKSILIVEDDPSAQILIKDILKTTGVKVFLSKTGEEGLKLFKQKPVDLILVDIKLHDINGLEVTKQIRSLSSGKQIPVIAQTAYAMEGDDHKSKDAGCDDYISKPIDINSLKKKIEKFL